MVRTHKRRNRRAARIARRWQVAGEGSIDRWRRLVVAALAYAGTSAEPWADAAWLRRREALGVALVRWVFSIPADVQVVLTAGLPRDGAACARWASVTAAARALAGAQAQGWKPSDAKGDLTVTPWTMYAWRLRKQGMRWALRSAGWEGREAYEAKAKRLGDDRRVAA